MSISNFEYKKMVITCLSPVHITDETGTVYSYQYLYDSSRQKVYFLNERLWVKFLDEHGLLEEFEQLITAGKMKAGTLCEWLYKKGFAADALGETVTDCADVAVPAEVVAANKTRLTEIVRTVHSVEGQPYIPGSSIKGALRTGLLYSRLLQEDRLRSAAWDEVCRLLEDKHLRDKNAALGRLAQKLEIALLHRLQIPKSETGAELLPKAHMNCSVMKGLSVSDSVGGRIMPVIVQKREAVYINKTGQVKTKNLNLFRECLPEGARQHFSITLDKAVFGGLGITTVAELIKCQQEFTSFVLSRQKEIFGSLLKREFLKGEAANLFLGSGSGFLSKSLLAVIAPDARAYTAAAAKILHNNFYRHAHLRLDKFTAPRALQIAKTGRGTTLMGICRITEE